MKRPAKPTFQPISPTSIHSLDSEQKVGIAVVHGQLLDNNVASVLVDGKGVFPIVSQMNRKVVANLSVFSKVGVCRRYLIKGENDPV